MTPQTKANIRAAVKKFFAKKTNSNYSTGRKDHEKVEVDFCGKESFRHGVFHNNAKNRFDLIFDANRRKVLVAKYQNSNPIIAQVYDEIRKNVGKSFKVETI